jgi:hypothetical protein
MAGVRAMQRMVAVADTACQETWGGAALLGTCKSSPARDPQCYHRSSFLGDSYFSNSLPFFAWLAHLLSLQQDRNTSVLMHEVLHVPLNALQHNFFRQSCISNSHPFFAWLAHLQSVQQDRHHSFYA